MATTISLEGYVPATGDSKTSFYNAVRDSPQEETVSELIEDTRTIVENALTLNQDYAAQAIADARTTMAALSTASFPPELPDPPPVPAINTTFGSATVPGFDSIPDLGSLSNEAIDPFVANPITVGDIGDIPDYTPIVTGVTLPAPPVYIAPNEPPEPSIDTTIDLPDAPTPDYGGAPTLDELNLPTYAAPDLPTLDAATPTFDTLPPDPFIQWTEPTYSSTVKDLLAGVIETMLAGGTGIPADVADAMWQRGRDREEANVRKAVDEVTAQWASRGFDAPGGPIDAQIIATRDAADRKVNELSRERVIQDAELEQKNRQFAVTSGLDYERIFVGVFLAIVERNFQIAKFHVETAIQVFNLQVTVFNVDRQIFEAKITKYRAELEAVFAYLKAFEAQVEAEKARAELNTAKVAVYRERIAAYVAQVQAYGSLIQAANARAALQEQKVKIFQAEIQAMVGKIEGQRAKFEAYDSAVKGETAKIGLEEANARAYEARLRGIGVRADIVFKQADVDLALNKERLDYSVANLQRIGQRTSYELSSIQARLAAYQGQTGRAMAKYGADKEAAQFNLTAQIEFSKLAIAQYTALLEQWKTRSQEIIQFGVINAESLRAAGQMASNLASGAMAGTHVSAGISAGSSSSQSSSRSTSASSSQSRNVNENDNFSIVHNYNHRT